MTTSEISADEPALGSWIADETGTPTLTFTEDGSVTGTDGCNRISSTFRIDDEGKILIHEFAITKMACRGVDAWLGGARTAVLEGESLAILNGSGKMIGTLQRSD